MISLLPLGQTPSGVPAEGLRNALLPSLPRLAVRTVNPSNAAAVIDELRQLQQAHTGPKRETLVEIIYEPGVYSEVGLGQDMVLSRSVSGNPDDVIIESAAIGGGVMHWYGTPTWIKGVTIRSLPDPDGGDGPKYPLHMTGGATFTAIDCRFEAFNPKFYACIGLDGGDGLRAAFVGCEFANLGGAVTLLHGGTVGPHGQEIAFYDSVVTSDGTPLDVGYAALDGTEDERVRLYFIGGNLIAGSLSGNDTEAHTEGWTPTVDGFAAYERLMLGLDPTPPPPDPEPAPVYDSVFEANEPPPGTYSIHDDAAPGIRLGQPFRGDGLPGKIVGGRVWLPEVPSGVTGLRIMGRFDSSINLDDAVGVGEVTDLKVGWNTAIFETPMNLPSSNTTPWYIYYEFMGDPDWYVFSGNFRSGPVEVGSRPNGLRIWTLYSIFRIAPGSPQSAGTIDTGYGIDTLVEFDSVNASE